MLPEIGKNPSVRFICTAEEAPEIGHASNESMVILGSHLHPEIGDIFIVQEPAAIRRLYKWRKAQLFAPAKEVPSAVA